MMKTTRLLLLLLLLPALGGLATVTDKVDGRLYSNPDFGFSILFPKGWTVQDTAAPVTVRGVSDKEDERDTFQEDVEVTCQPVAKGILPATYTRQVKTAMQTAQKNCTIDREFEGKLNGVPARAFVLSYTRDGIDLQVLCYTLVKDDRGFTIVCHAARDASARFAGIFQTVALSFTTFAPTPPPPKPTRQTWSDQGFSMIPPVGWTVKSDWWPKITDKVICFNRPKVGVKEVYETIYIYHETVTASSLTKYLELHKEKLKSTLPNYKALAQGEGTLGGKPARFHICTCTLQGTDLTMARFLVIDDDRGYVITCVARQESFSTYQELFQQTVTSFEFAEKPAEALNRALGG